MNLYDKWFNEKNTDMREMLSVGDFVEFNGICFSDDYCFDKGSLYKVLEVTVACIKLKTKFKEIETEVDVYPDGFPSFDITGNFNPYFE